MNNQCIEFYRLIRDFLTVYLPKQKAASVNTIKSYKNAMNLLIDYIKELLDIPISEIGFDTITRAYVESFLEWLENERGCSVSTRNQRLSCIRAFYKYASGRDITLMSYRQELDKIPLKKQKTVQKIKFFSENALKNILAQPDIMDKREMRNLFFMILMYDTAARNQEMLDVRLDDVHISTDGSYVVLTGKGNKTRIVPIMDKTVEHYKKYVKLFHQESRGNEFLFYTIRRGEKFPMSPDNAEKFIRKYGNQARIQNNEVPENLHPHMFRHSRAMHLYRGGMPLPLLSEWLGHAQIETTLIYANADTKMKQKAIEKATSRLNPLINDGITIDWREDEEMIKRLYGLA